MPDAASSRIAVGRVTRAHGIHGEVSVLVLSEVEDRFAEGAEMFLEDGRRLTVERARGHRSRLLVKFEGVRDRSEAETLHQRYLFVDQSAVPPAPEGSFWPHQLEGCEVVTESARSLGVIREVVHGEANDIWVTSSGEGDVLVPALRDVIVSVDVAANRVVVRDVPGLTVPE